MKTKVISLFLLSSIGIVGCTQNSQLYTPTCERDNTGTMKVVNNLGDPYRVYLNNSLKGSVGAFTSRDFENLSVGTYSARYEQASGYLLYPTIYSGSMTIVQCETSRVDLNP